MIGTWCLITTVTPTINVLDLSELHGFLYFLDRKHLSLSFCRDVHPLLDLSLRLFQNCEGSGDVVGVVTPLGGVAQAFHGDQVVELRVQLAVQEVEGKEEDREGQVEVEEEKRLKEVRSWMTMEMK